jgi:hypothetical protein
VRPFFNQLLCDHLSTADPHRAPWPSYCSPRTRQRACAQVCLLPDDTEDCYGCLNSYLSGRAWESIQWLSYGSSTCASSLKVRSGPFPPAQVSFFSSSRTLSADNTHWANRVASIFATTPRPLARAGRSVASAPRAIYRCALPFVVVALSPPSPLQRHF